MTSYLVVECRSFWLYSLESWSFFLPTQCITMTTMKKNTILPSGHSFTDNHANMVNNRWILRLFNYKPQSIKNILYEVRIIGICACIIFLLYETNGDKIFKVRVITHTHMKAIDLSSSYILNNWFILYTWVLINKLNVLWFMRVVTYSLYLR